MRNTQSVTVDIMDSHIYEYLTVAQYDAETIFQISITRYGEPYSVPNMGAMFTMKKPDGHIIVNGCTVSGNKVLVNSTYQMTVLSGKIPFQIVLFSDNDMISSITGSIIVVQSANYDSGEGSTDEYTIVQQLGYYTTLAKSYVVGDTGIRPSENFDNIKYYYEISRSSVTGLTPKGWLTFEQLMLLSPRVNDMYNITNAFESNDRFKDGGNYYYPAGTNVYYTTDHKWDVLVGHMVTGVKGAAETTYRTGNVNITKANIDLPNGRNIINSANIPSTPPDIWLQPFSIE